MLYSDMTDAELKLEIIEIDRKVREIRQDPTAYTNIAMLIMDFRRTQDNIYKEQCRRSRQKNEYGITKQFPTRRRLPW